MTQGDCRYLWILILQILKYLSLLCSRRDMFKFIMFKKRYVYQQRTIDSKKIADY